jgi:hypothetical protein
MPTDFGQYTLMKLVSSWPKLRVVSVLVFSVLGTLNIHSVNRPSNRYSYTSLETQMAAEAGVKIYRQRHVRYRA